MSNVSFNGRVDRNNIPEGFPAIATALWKNLRPFMWIQNGVTCTVHTLSDTGEIQVPIFSPDSMGEITPLCDEAIPATGKFETLPVRIDSNAATRMAGCFRSFGINDKQITAGLMQANLGTLGLTLLKSFENELIAKGRRFNGTITYNTELTPLNIVSALESDFIHETGNTPTFMLVSKRMFDVLRAYVSERPTNLGDRTLITGSVGVINNIDVIPTQITDADIIMMNKDSLRDTVRENLIKVSHTGIGKTCKPFPTEINNKIKGFSHPDAILTAIETRSSADSDAIRESRPSRARGLKLGRYDQAGERAGSRPSRARGLKHGARCF